MTDTPERFDERSLTDIQEAYAKLKDETDRELAKLEAASPGPLANAFDQMHFALEAARIAGRWEILAALGEAGLKADPSS